MTQGEARGYMPVAQRHDWETPRELFDQLWEEFGGFDLDPCCTLEQYTAKRVLANDGGIFVPKGAWPPNHPDNIQILEDGLAQPWRGKVYMNPPYGREIAAWVEKAAEEVKAGGATLVVALLPVRTDTRWWQRHILRSVWMLSPGAVHAALECRDVRFLPGRLRFGGTDGPAPFPSCIVVWRRQPRLVAPAPQEPQARMPLEDNVP